MSGILMSAFIGGAFIFDSTIANPANYNLRSAAIAAGWDQISILLATITVTGTVSATSTGTAAFSTGSGFPGGSRLALTIAAGGRILGMGGNGGDGSGGGIDGKPGGSAINAGYQITVTNNGIIAGGGGGGGCSIHDNYGDYYQRQAAGGNGGSSGLLWSSGGGGTWSGAFGKDAYAGDWWRSENTHYTTDGAVIKGGSGGRWGESGYSASGGNAYNGVGGSGGPAVQGNSLITWLATGTRYGSIT